MTAPIRADDLITLKGGDRRICVVTEAGSLPRMTKDGEVQAPYAVGDLLMANARGDVLVPPISGERLGELARAIIEGHERASTESRNHLAVAMGFVVMCLQIETEPEPPSTEPQAAALAIPQEANHA